MPYVYRNSNTGDEVTREERSVRLDLLDNWTLVAEPEDPATSDDPPADPPQGEQQTDPTALPAAEPTEQPPAEASDEPAKPKRPARPAKG